MLTQRYGCDLQGRTSRQVEVNPGEYNGCIVAAAAARHPCPPFGRARRDPVRESRGSRVYWLLFAGTGLETGLPLSFTKKTSSFVRSVLLAFSLTRWMSDGLS